MKTILSLLGALALAVFVPRASAAAEITFQTFYDGLSPYGDWVEIDDYGYCWQPWVDSGWAPYTDGEWAKTDAGWTWVSNEDFGWATYHYGRWMQVNGRGWVWVPGYEWGPGWVSWRNNNDYVGWAPLPPRAVWRPSVGIGIGVDLNFGIGPSWYNFCPVRYFGNRGLRPYIVPRYNNVNIINNSVNVTNISVVNNNIYNGGPDYNQINRYAERPVPQYRLNRQNNIDLRNPRFNRGRIEGDTLNVAAPRVNPDRGQFRPAKVAGQVPRDQIRSNGWDDVKPAEARQIRENIRQQAREDRQQLRDDRRNDRLAGNDNNLPPNATAPGRGRPDANPSSPGTLTGNENRGNRFGDRGANDQPLAANTAGEDRQSRRERIIRDMEARRQGKTPPSANTPRNESNPRGDAATPNRRDNNDANSLPSQARRDQANTAGDQSARASKRDQIIREMEARRQGKSTPKSSETANRPNRQQENAQANTPPTRQNRPEEQTARNAKRDDIIRQMEARRAQQGQSSTPKRSQPSRDEAAPQRNSRNDDAAAAAQRARQREAQQNAAQRQNNSQRESLQRQAQQQNERRQAAAQQQDNARRQMQNQQRQQAQRPSQPRQQADRPAPQQRPQMQQQRQPQRQAAPQQSRSERQSSREEKKSKKDDN